MALADPVIVVPGITATFLRDEYPLPPDNIWKVIKKDFDRIVLHPNDMRYEAREPARVVPGQVFEVAYEELIEELRYNLKAKEDEVVPVFPFGYDWRMPLETIEAQLDEFIEEVIQRTRLLKHYNKAGYDKNPRVNLVGHSMGGLVITGYLEQKKKNAPVNKVATLATPFLGSFEAVIKVATGTANLGISAPSSREREAARLTPALYYLTPSFKKGITTDPTLPNSLFDADVWQPSVIDSIAEFIRLKGLPTKQKKKDAKILFKKLLVSARGHRNRVSNFKLSEAGLSSKDWLAIVGVDATTRVHLKIGKLAGKANFEFKSSDRKNEWEDDDARKARLTGDGTVPFEGAIPPFLNEENLVCVTPGDFGYWEAADRVLTKAAGFHGIIANMNMLHRMVVRFLTDRPDRRGNTWGRRVPGVANWNPPISLTERKER